MGSLHWSLSTPRKMKLSLILALAVAAVSYGTPLKPDEDLELEDLVDHREMSPLVTEDNAAKPDELQRSRRSAHGCAYQVKVSGADKSKGPYQNHAPSFGTYTIQNGAIHGRDWWKKDSHAIWYTGYSWRVGHVADKGSTTSYFSTDDDDYCPEGVGYTWEYYVASIDDWIDAGRHMTIFTAS